MLSHNEGKPTSLDNSAHGRGRRWLRVRVAVLLLVPALLGVGGVIAGLTYHRYAREERAIRRLRALNASIGRKWQGPEWLARALHRCRLPVPTGLGGIDRVDPGFCDDDLKLLRHCAGIEYLDLDRTRVTDAGMVYLRRFPRLRILELRETGVTDAGLAHVRGLKGLGALTLNGTKITDSGLLYLQELHDLHQLDLGDTPVTDRGLDSLTGLTNLELLGLEGTGVTEEGITRLKRALPRTKIRGP